VSTHVHVPLAKLAMACSPTGEAACYSVTKEACAPCTECFREVPRFPPPPDNRVLWKCASDTWIDHVFQVLEDHY
jgi:hypothetical protein